MRVRRRPQPTGRSRGEEAVHGEDVRHAALDVHGSPTDRGDSVVLARAGAGKSEEEKKRAEEKALAAAQELRTESVRRSKRAFKAWKVRRAYKEAWRRVDRRRKLRRGWNALRK